MSVIDITNWIGTLTFAISGALVAVKKRFDLLGVIILGSVTAVGGGATRDVIIGHVPMALENENLLWGVIIISIITMYTANLMHKFDRLLIYFDALGLGVFSVLGAELGCQIHLSMLGVIFLGAISGAGGGVYRDLLSNQIPAIMLPGELYASAAAAGAYVFFVLFHTYPNAALLLGASTTVIIRIASVKWGLALPTAKE